MRPVNNLFSFFRLRNGKGTGEAGRDVWLLSGAGVALMNTVLLQTALVASIITGHYCASAQLRGKKANDCDSYIEDCGNIWLELDRIASQLDT